MSTVTSLSVVDMAHELYVLWSLATTLPHLPAAGFDVDPEDVRARVAIHVHNDPGAFEQWREALDFDPGTAQSHDYSDFTAVSVTGTYCGVAIRLVGYLPLPAAEPAETPAAPAPAAA